MQFDELHTEVQSSRETLLPHRWPGKCSLKEWKNWQGLVKYKKMGNWTWRERVGRGKTFVEVKEHVPTKRDRPLSLPNQSFKNIS